MTRRLRPWLAVALAGLLASPALAARPVDRVTLFAGPERSVELQLARDLARVIGAASGLNTLTVTTPGSLDTLNRLREGGTRLAIVPADLAPAFRAAAAAGHAEASVALAPLRALTLLPAANFHFIVRADSGLTRFEDLRGARINFGPANGGTAASALHLYRAVFGEPVADDKASFLSHEDALARLVTDGSIDVVALLATPPVRLLTDMTPEARRYVRLLAAAPATIADPGGFRPYRADRLAARHYPSLLDADLDGIAVPNVLVVHEERRGATGERAVQFARQFCASLERLRRDGHPSWRDAEPRLPDPGLGWPLPSPAVGAAIAPCLAGIPADARPPVCTATERVLQVCD